MLSRVLRSFRFTSLEWNEKRREKKARSSGLRISTRPFSSAAFVLLFCNRDSGPKRRRHNECGQVCPSFEERKKRSRVRSERRTPREEKNETLRWVEKNGPLAYNFSSLVRISFRLLGLYSRKDCTTFFVFRFLSNCYAILLIFHFLFNMREVCYFHITLESSLLPNFIKVTIFDRSD